MRVPIYERREGISPLQGGNVSPVMPAGDNGASAAGVVKGLALRLQQMQDDTEDARTLELFNKFKNDSMEYHENPDKGIYNTRLGYQSQGVFSEADEWLRQRGESYVNQLRSERSKANFRRMARDYIVQRGTQNSRFEAAQMIKYQTEQAEATYKNRINDIALNPYDDNYVNNTRQGIIDALELKLRGASPEARSLALAGMEDDIAVARFSAMFNDNPAKANEWYNKNADSFSAQNKQKFQNALEGYRVQSFVDGLIQQFPQGQEQEAIKYIRENFSGDREERIVSAYKTRANENAIKEVNQGRLLRDQQNTLEDQILKEFYVNGNMPSEEQLRQFVASDQLRAEQAERIRSRQDISARRSRIEQRIITSNPSLSRLELDEQVMEQMGTTNEEHKSIFAACANAILTGEADTKILDFYYNRGKLTTDDVNNIKKNYKTLSGVQKEFFNSEKRLLEKNINTLIKDYGFSEENRAKIIEEFITRAGLELDNQLDKNYREKLQELSTEVLLNAIDNSGEPTTTRSFFGSKEKWFDFFGERNTELGEFRNSINNRIFSPNLPLPELSPSDIDLDSIPTGTIGNSGNLALDMVQGGKITGRFADWRAYRKGQHNGIDIAAPEGTNIVLTDYKTLLTVDKVRLGSETAGNYVILKGKYDNGDTIELQINHMKDNSINVKKGDVLNVGSIIGQVGKTGHATGAHMDLKIKINGKYVDPETWKPPINNVQKQTVQRKTPPDDIFGLAFIFN